MADALWNDIIYTDVLQSNGHAFLVISALYVGHNDRPDRNSHALSSPDTGDHQ